MNRPKSAYYLVRLDDACPTMNSHSWSRIENILDKYNIKPLVGIIPNNQDNTLLKDEADPIFWDKARNWQAKGWEIGLHGYNHVYVTNDGGINPIHSRSEFAGLSLKEQEEKIDKGLKILENENLNVKFFFAPSHTFDKNTLIALHNKSKIIKISDTISRIPYKLDGMVFYPQQKGEFIKIRIKGFWTFCYHPNEMNDRELLHFEIFIKQNHTQFISFDEIDVKKITTKSIIDRYFSFSYFLYRKFKKLFS